jgi:hypothetical protein
VGEDTLSNLYYVGDGIDIGHVVSHHPSEPLVAVSVRGAVRVVRRDALTPLVTPADLDVFRMSTLTHPQDVGLYRRLGLPIPRRDVQPTLFDMEAA